jgi:hypothetical protein
MRNSNQLLGAMETAGRKRIDPHLDPVKLKLGDVARTSENDRSSPLAEVNDRRFVRLRLHHPLDFTTRADHLRSFALGGHDRVIRGGATCDPAISG